MSARRQDVAGADASTLRTVTVKPSANAAPDSVVGEATAGLPDHTLVLIDAANDSRPAAVIADEDAATFEHWVRLLPED
jgi:hypothetical protein